MKNTRGLAIAISLSALVALLVSTSAVITAVTTLSILGFSLAAWLRPHIGVRYVHFLGLGLLGYAFFGRGFAYLGIPPLYVGELLLILGLVAIVASGSLLTLGRSAVTWLLVIFMTIGLISTIPHVPTYGLSSLRDATIWGYGLFSIIVASLVTSGNLFTRIPFLYARTIPWFLAWIPIALLLSRMASIYIPMVPQSTVPVISLKSGDLGVHLAGVLAFLAIGLHRSALRNTKGPGQEWLAWSLWVLAFALIFNNRGGVLTVLVTASLVLVVLPFGRWGKIFTLAALAVTLFIGLDIKIPITPTRTVSADTIIASVQSLFGETGDRGFDGTRQWRLDWWSDIFNYTVLGEYFWTGKGYGINLATADGYQVTSDESLRSPHNGHITILARSGVPGAIAWILLQLTYSISLLHAYFRSRREGRPLLSQTFLWLFAYWLAFMTNSSFDVYLEGPQGGIWFWSMFGVGIAALELQRRSRQQAIGYRRAAQKI